MKFANTQPGDDIFIIYRGKYSRDKVTRVTNTQVIVEIPNLVGDKYERRFHKKDGYEIGASDSFYRTRIDIWSQEMQTKVDNENLLEKVRGYFRIAIPNDPEKAKRINDFIKAEGLI